MGDRSPPHGALISSRVHRRRKDLGSTPRRRETVGLSPSREFGPIVTKQGPSHRSQGALFPHPCQLQIAPPARAAPALTTAAQTPLLIFDNIFPGFHPY